MNSKNIKLSVIIPAYNESKRIGETLLDIDKYLSRQDYSYEILVVNDGSTDNTVEVVTSYKKLVSNLSVINNSENHGKGYVVRKGMLEAQGEYRLFTDADGSTSIDHLEKIWPLAEDHDVVIGSRDSRDAKGAKQAVPQPLMKRLLGDVGNILIQIFGVRGVWDTQNGFKVFKSEAAQIIFSKTVINGWGFDIEALALARKLKYKIGIIPVYWVNDPESHVTLGGYIKTFVELFKIRLNLMRNVYGISGKEKK
ncbi:MAG: dolichyl-phosphate beta-glucosyltransferase [Candidatus Spechtbacterales bacterium]